MKANHSFCVPGCPSPHTGMTTDQMEQWRAEEFKRQQQASYQEQQLMYYSQYPPQHATPPSHHGHASSRVSHTPDQPRHKPPAAAQESAGNCFCIFNEAVTLCSKSMYDCDTLPFQLHAPFCADPPAKKRKRNS